MYLRLYRFNSCSYAKNNQERIHASVAFEPKPWSCCSPIASKAKPAKPLATESGPCFAYKCGSAIAFGDSVMGHVPALTLTRSKVFFSSTDRVNLLDICPSSCSNYGFQIGIMSRLDLKPPIQPVSFSRRHVAEPRSCSRWMLRGDGTTFLSKRRPSALHLVGSVFLSPALSRRESSALLPVRVPYTRAAIDCFG